MNSGSRFTRRALLQATGFGIGGLALSWLLNQQTASATEQGALSSRDLRPRPGDFPAHARAMVHFMQNGGPSQMDLFDPKPELQKRAGQSIPESIEIYQKGNSDKLLASPFGFQRRVQ